MPNESIGERLRMIRGGLSKDEFSKLLGVHKQTILRYENNERTPDASFLLAIHKIMRNADIGWIVTGERNKTTLETEEETKRYNIIAGICFEAVQGNECIFSRETFSALVDIVTRRTFGFTLKSNGEDATEEHILDVAKRIVDGLTSHNPSAELMLALKSLRHTASFPVNLNTL